MSSNFEILCNFSTSVVIKSHPSNIILCYMHKRIDIKFLNKNSIQKKYCQLRVLKNKNFNFNLD